MLKNFGWWCAAHPWTTTFACFGAYLGARFCRTIVGGLESFTEEARWRWNYRRSHGSLRRRSR